MLTVKEINEVSFGKAGFSGYKPEDVDNFIDQVAASFQELLGERDAAMKQVGELAALNTELAGRNADAQKKLSILAQKVESYRQEEEGIKEAIISAQRMSKELVAEAQGKADSIIQESRAQAEAKLLEANEEARKITANAQEDAAKAAKEYAQQVETKRNELEEIKRQVTAFRLALEMYKKHLECIDHIPTFRNKPDRSEQPKQAPTPIQAPAPAPVQAAPEPPAVTEPQPEPQPEPQVQEPAEPEPQFQVYEPPVIHEAPSAVPEPVEALTVQEQTVFEDAAQPEPQYVESSVPMRHSRQAVVDDTVSQASAARQDTVRQARTLNDRVNYVQEQLRPSAPPELYLGENDLSSVGIDLTANVDIPEALIEAKRNNYNALFNEGAEQDGRRRKR